MIERYAPASVMPNLPPSARRSLRRHPDAFTPSARDQRRRRRDRQLRQFAGHKGIEHYRLGANETIGLMHYELGWICARVTSIMVAGVGYR